MAGPPGWHDFPLDFLPIVMSLNPDDVRRIARLARLEISDQEVERTGQQLNGILAFIEQLQAVDTTGVAPMAHAVDVVQRLRPDQVTETDRRAAFQAIAPETEAGLYLVPKVIE
jgi:aspartyl-tRNA(Asn)/glutamyl-tRNA(Gln) amidotransferase subunit C